jgi:hypothetical protein
MICITTCTYTFLGVKEKTSRGTRYLTIKIDLPRLYRSTGCQMAFGFCAVSHDGNVWLKQQVLLHRLSVRDLVLFKSML